MAQKPMLKRNLNRVGKENKMVTHRFICNRCKIFIEDTTTKGIHKCPECGGDAALDCKIAIHGNYKHPIHSDALAISPTQIAEHEKLFPNIRLDKACRPIFEKFSDHEAYMKKCGIVKHRQRIKSKGKRIA